MKCFPVLLLFFLLMGCAPGNPPAQSETEVPPEPTGLYRSGSTLEAATGGALRCYPLGELVCTGLRSLPGGILLFSDTDTGTACTLLTGDTAIPQAELALPFFLDSQDPSIHPWADGFSCYDPESGEILTLDGCLQITGRIPLPRGLVGSPILSQDGTTVYFCKDNALRALDLKSGISRVLRQSGTEPLTIAALLAEDTILQCTQEGNTLFLQTDTGGTLYHMGDSPQVLTAKDSFYVNYYEGGTALYLFGQGENPPQSLIFPTAHTVGLFLPQDHAAVGLCRGAGDALELSRYDLATGRRTASVTFALPSGISVLCSDSLGNIWFLGQYSPYPGTTLFRWQPDKSPVKDDRVYTARYHPADQPDDEGIAQCLAIAQEIQVRYGISIHLVPSDTPDSQQWRLEFEHQSPVLQRELEALEKELEAYPAEFLQTLTERFEELRISIVREFVPLTPQASPDPVCRSLYWDGFQPCIALTIGTDTGRTLSHTLCHLADTVVLNGSSAYDTWEELNPTGFQYDCDYETNLSRNSTAYLQESHRYFVDMYAMSFPKEDRARILEYAMAPGNHLLFQGDAMQAKLLRICTGLREAFPLEEYPLPLPWEQYLIDKKR